MKNETDKPIDIVSIGLSVSFYCLVKKKLIIRWWYKNKMKGKTMIIKDLLYSLWSIIINLILERLLLIICHRNSEISHTCLKMRIKNILLEFGIWNFVVFLFIIHNNIIWDLTFFFVHTSMTLDFEDRLESFLCVWTRMVVFGWGLKRMLVLNWLYSFHLR